MNITPNKKTIIITGSSSGIGKELAISYAKKYSTSVTLHLSGRNIERLKHVQLECNEYGANTLIENIDVCDKSAMHKWLTSIQDKTPIDIIIANAGISGGTGGDKNGESISQARKIFDTNITGILNTIEPVLPSMIERKQGSIAIMSSLASFQSWPSAPAYSASKSCVRVYGEALRASLSKTNVKISVICPGFVKSPMTDVNEFPMPFLMDTEKAANIIIKGIEKNKARIAFPAPSYSFALLTSTLSSFFPQILPEKLLSLLPAKNKT